MILNQNTDLLNLEIASERVSMAIQNAIRQLNASHAALWSLPDDRLIATLQWLFDNNKLTEVFEKHYAAACGLNVLAEVAGIDVRAVATIGREFTLTEGLITLPAPIIDSELDPIS